MADLLKNLVEKARGNSKTQGEVEEGKGREDFEFGDGFQLDVFEGAENYTPQSPQGWDGRIPEEGGMAEQLNKTVERNKSN